MAFSALGLSPSLVEVLEQQKFIAPYPIQRAVIPAVLQRKDVLGIAATGSGKTASYVLPLLTLLQKGVQSKNRHAAVLVLVPTRELAEQVKEVFRIFSEGLPQRVKTVAVYGGVSINPQMMALQGVSVLVATPGRLLELIDCNAVHLAHIEVLVLDEADKLLNLGFEKEVKRIFLLLPAMRQNLLFSATLNENVEAINQIILNHPLVVKTEVEAENLDLITQLAYSVEEEKKGPLLRYLIAKEEMKQVLVFTSSVYRADTVADKLRKNGIDAQAIHSKKSQGARTDALSKFKAGKLRVLVATDLMSRGIDVQFLPYVINYELPRSPKDYVHRIGRTGRAENPGTAISLVGAEEEHHFKVIQKKMKKLVELVSSEGFDLFGNSKHKIKTEEKSNDL